MQPQSIIVKFVLALSILSSVVFAQAIDAPPGGLPSQLPRENDANIWWLLPRGDIQVYADAELTRPLPASDEVAYLSQFRECWRDGRAVLLSRNTERGKRLSPDDLVGWISEADALRSEEGKYKAQSNYNIYRKLLTVHRWDRGGAPEAAVPAYDRPSVGGERVDSQGLFEVLYRYGSASGEDFVLAATKPNVLAGSADVEQSFTGWLESRRVFSWDTRQAVHYNKERDFLRCRSQQDAPIPFFIDLDRARAGNVDIRENLENAQAAKYFEPRFPIIGDQGDYWHVGFIGDSYTTSGQPGFERAQIAEIQQKLTELSEGVGQVDVLFVIDATASMDRFFQSIKETVRETVFPEQAEDTTRYAVGFYRDYTEDPKQESTSFHFENFRTRREFLRDEGPVNTLLDVGAQGGQANPPPFYGIDSAVKMADWRKFSTRLVILIGDMGNQVPDRREYTLEGVANVLKEYGCEFHAVQVPLEVANSPNQDVYRRRAALFTTQAQELVRQTGGVGEVLSPSGTEIQAQLQLGIAETNDLIDKLQIAIDRLQAGEAFDSAIAEALSEAGVALSQPNSRSEVVRSLGGGGNVSMNVLSNELRDRLIRDLEIDPDIFAEAQVQFFSAGYAPKIDECGNPAFDEYYLMSRNEFTKLMSFLGDTAEADPSPKGLGDVWNGIINSMTGEDDDPEAMKDLPISQIVERVYGVPVKTNLLQLKVDEIYNLPEDEILVHINDIEERLRMMQNFDDEKRPDGTGTEPHWFIRNGRDFAWVPIEISP